MTTLKIASALIAILFAAFAEAQGMGPQEPLPKQPVPPIPVACTEQFLNDYDLAAESFIQVFVAAESKVDDNSFRRSVMTAVNSCHDLVERHVVVDSVNHKWTAGICSRTVIGESGQVANLFLTPVAHKAECEYLQRLLNHADSFMLESDVSLLAK